MPLEHDSHKSLENDSHKLLEYDRHKLLEYGHQLLGYDSHERHTGDRVNNGRPCFGCGNDATPMGRKKLGMRIL